MMETLTDSQQLFQKNIPKVFSNKLLLFNHKFYLRCFINGACFPNVLLRKMISLFCFGLTVYDPRTPLERIDKKKFKCYVRLSVFETLQSPKDYFHFLSL